MTMCASLDVAIAQKPGDDVRVGWDPDHGLACGLRPNQRVGGWTSAAGVSDSTAIAASADPYDVRQVPELTARNITYRAGQYLDLSIVPAHRSIKSVKTTPVVMRFWFFCWRTCSAVPGSGGPFPRPTGVTVHVGGKGPTSCRTLLVMGPTSTAVDRDFDAVCTAMQTDFDGLGIADRSCAA